MNTENIKTNEPHKFVLNLSQRFDLKSSNKNVAFQDLSIYYTWKNIRKQNKNNKRKIIALPGSDDFELTDGFYSVSDIWDYIEYIISISPLHVYIIRINNGSVFKIRDR